MWQRLPVSFIKSKGKGFINMENVKNTEEIEVTQEKGYKALNPKIKKNIRAVKFFTIGLIFVCLATDIIVVMCNYIGNRNFRETFYSVSSTKVDSPVRVVQLSDLHSTLYGENNKKLLIVY